MITIHSIVYPSPAVASRILEGEAVLVHASRGEVKVLNTLGAEVWELLDGRRSVGEIVDNLLLTYAVDRAQIESDVIGFMESLHQRELIVVREADTHP